MMFQTSLFTKIVFILVFVVIESQGSFIPTYCNQTIRPKDSARFSFQKTEISLITPRCPLNGLRWKRPKFNHIVVFSRLQFSFQLCFTVHNPGASIYRLRGTSKQPVAASNVSGSLGCLESHCQHVTFQLEPPLGLETRRIDYTFSYLRIYKNPRCTEVCMRFCLCDSRNVFIGSFQHSIEDKQTRLYRLYFKIIYIIKRDGIYSSPPHAAPYNHFCPGDTDVHDTTNTTLTQMVLNSDHFALPKTGVVKVYGKYPLDTIGKKYLIAGSYYRLGGKWRLIMCCLEEDGRYAANLLRSMILKKDCKC